MAPYFAAPGVDVARPSVSLSPYLEVVTGEAQLKLGLTAYALRPVKPRVDSITTLYEACWHKGFDQAQAPDIPLDELLSRVMPL